MIRWFRQAIENIGKLPDVEKLELSNGLNGNLETIKIMSSMARKYSGHPFVRRLATSILDEKKIPSHYYLDEAKAIGEWVQKNVRYVRDANGTEQLHAPDMLVRQLSEVGYTMGDCDDMALLTAAMLISIGGQPFFRAIRYNGNYSNYNHIYIVVYESNVDDMTSPPPRKRFVMDTIVKNQKLGFEMPHASGDEFAI